MAVNSWHARRLCCLPTSCVPPLLYLYTHVAALCCTACLLLLILLPPKTSCSCMNYCFATLAQG